MRVRSDMNTTGDEQSDQTSHLIVGKAHPGTDSGGQMVLKARRMELRAAWTDWDGLAGNSRSSERFLYAMDASEIALVVFVVGTGRSSGCGNLNTCKILDPDHARKPGCDRNCAPSTASTGDRGRSYRPP